MDPDTINTLSYSISRGLVTLLQVAVVIVGLASILFLVACLFCALGGEFKEKKQPAVDDGRAEDKGLGKRAAVSAACGERALRAASSNGVESGIITAQRGKFPVNF